MSKEHFHRSFTIKILGAMILIAIVPMVASLLIFNRIDDFNQNLQKEAAESIEGVSDIYRSWVKAESSRIELIKRNIELEVDALLAKYQITHVSEITQSKEFQSELKQLFDRIVNSTDLAVEIQLSLNMTPLVQTGSSNLDKNQYKRQIAAIPIALRTRFNEAKPSVNADLDEMPVLIAEPVEGEYSGASDLESLPEEVSAISEAAPVSMRGIQLIVVFAIDRAQEAQYQQLGENRYRHGSISAMEDDDDSSVTKLYQNIFITIAAIVFILAIIGALYIAIPLSRQMSELTRATKSIADGDLNTKVLIKSKNNDEMTFLMTQFNTMVDELRGAQESKAYIERMQAWQEVARRLAHEIKNPLTPIVLAVQQLDGKFQDYIDNPPKYRRLLTNAVEIVTEETETLRKLVKNFSEFARMPIPEKKPVCFYEFVANVIEQNPQFNEEAKRVTLHEPEEKFKTIVIEIDNELMRRVVINIVRNGIEAARNAHFEPEIDLMIAQPDDEKHTLCLRIIDNGPGLTDEQKSKLFMPYFTTKSDGTGLGLAIVRKIIEDHNGRIALHDRDDGQRGTQADITL